MAKKMKEVTDVNEAMEILGHNTPEAIPGEEVPVTTVDKEPKVEVKEEPKVEQIELDTSVEQKVSTTQDEDGNITAEEQQRRTWQAEADRAKAEKERIEREYQERLAQAQEQNRNLLNTLTPFMMKYNEQPKEETEPEPDFIEDGYFDPKKYADYQKRHDQWLLTQAESRSTNRWRQEQQEQTTQVQLQEIAREYPEYVNPLTGEVDTKRLERDLKAYTSKKTLIDLVHEVKGKKKEVNPLNNAASISAIEKNANKPQSVASTVESTPEKKEVPEALKQMTKVFGGYDLPPDFDGLE